MLMKSILPSIFWYQYNRCQYQRTEPSQTLVSINVATQTPLKLTSTNYSVGNSSSNLSSLAMLMDPTHVRQPPLHNQIQPDPITTTLSDPLRSIDP